MPQASVPHPGSLSSLATEALGFDPKEGTVLRVPPGEGPGHWAGAPKAFFDRARGRFYLYYRLRRPRGMGRGFEARVAASDDGLDFRDVWRVTNHELSTSSIEGSALYTTEQGVHLYLSYVDPSSGRWCIDIVSARRVEELDPAQRRRLLRVEDVPGAQSVKDPVLFEEEGRLHMLFVCGIPAHPLDAPELARIQESQDAHATGLVQTHTYLAVASDLDRFHVHGAVMQPPATGWDRHAARITAVLAYEGRYLAFYDGAAGVEENYEEHCGLAEAPVLAGPYRSLTPHGPLLRSPWRSGAVRYVDALRVGTDLWCFYEFTREDGAHDLRVLKRRWPVS